MAMLDAIGTDIIGAAALAVVSLLLAITLLRQFAVSGNGWALADHLTLAPQWKFFGQSRIDQQDHWGEDLHLLARRADGAWQEVYWEHERRLGETLWNPRVRSRSALVVLLDVLVHDADLPPTALAYLSVLTHVAQALPSDPRPLQFAVAATFGRGERGLALRFLSHWHGT